MTNLSKTDLSNLAPSHQTDHPQPLHSDAAAAIANQLYVHGPASRRELAESLQLSLPTVDRALRELMRCQLIESGPPRPSTGGRRAYAFAFANSNHVAIGISANRGSLHIRSVNLAGEVSDAIDRVIPQYSGNAYWQRVGNIVNDFADATERHATIIATACAAPGILTPDGGMVEFDLATASPDASLRTLIQTLRRPCTLIRQAEARATAQLWADRTIDDALCIYLDHMVSGAVIVDGAVNSGPNRCNGTIAHMTLVPDGLECRCGRRGCMDAYCSPTTLTEDGESLPGFFSVLEQGEPNHRRRLDAWMDHLAQAIAAARSVICGDVILGGQIAQYLDDADIAGIARRVRERMPFGMDQFAVHAAMPGDEQAAIGAAQSCVGAYVAALGLDPIARFHSAHA